MIANFVNLADNKFTLNGIEYHKNYAPIQVNQSDSQVRVISAYDSRFQLVPPTHYSEYTVNGVTYGSVESLIHALVDVVFSKFTLDGVAKEFQDSVLQYVDDLQSDISGFKGDVNTTVNNFQSTVNNDLQQITAEKQVFESEAQEIKDAVANMTTTGKIYDSLADAIAESPKPADGTPFSVMGDGDNDGYYKFDSTQPDGVKFGRKFDRRLQVESISQLKNYKGRPGEAVDVLGYYEKGDGGGGTFYWDAASTEEDNGGTIIESSGEVNGRWKRRFEGPVNVKWFGAKGDGVADDTMAIQKTIDYVNNGKVVIDAGIFRTTAKLNLKPDKDLEIVGGGVGVTEFYCDAGFMNINNTITSETFLNEIAEKGKSNLKVESASGIEIGDLLTIVSTENMPETTYTIRKGHSGIVTHIDGNTITIDRPLPTDFNISGYTATVQSFKTGQIVIKNFSASGEYEGYFFDIYRTQNLLVDNIKVINRQKTYQGVLDGGNMSAIRITDSVNATFSNLKFEYIHYGVMPTRGTSVVTVQDSTATRCRHIVAPTGGSQNFKGLNLNSYGCFAGLDSHQSAYNSYFFGCNDYNNEIEAKFRGRYDVIENCFFDGNVEFRNDPGIIGVIVGDELQKKIINTIVRGGIGGVSNSLSVEKCEVFGRLTHYMTYKGDLFKIEDTNIYYYEEDSYAIVLSFMKKTILKNVNIYGKHRGIEQTSSTLPSSPSRAIYANRYDEDSLTLENVVIDGFDEGLDLRYSADLSNWSINNLLIRNCVVGIHPHESYKDNLYLNGLTFKGCATDVEQPFRFRNLNFGLKRNSGFTDSIYNTPHRVNFEKSPYVPAPTELNNVANKEYVDNKLSQGATGTYTSQDGKTVTVENGIITSIE